MTEQDVGTYLKREFAADAVIVVGSRADNVARDGSDWDCYVLIDDGTGPTVPRPEPRELEGAQLDIGVVHLPIGEADVLRVFGPNLQQAKVLFDTPANSARRIVDCAAVIYAAGKRLTDYEKAQRAHQMARNISTMRARSDQPGPFFEAMTFVFYISHRFWYEVLHGRYSQSVHRAMDEIQTRDPDFHARLMTLTSSESIDAKIAAAEYLHMRLFGG